MEKTINRLRKWSDTIEEMKEILDTMGFETEEAEANEYKKFRELYVCSHKEYSLTPEGCKLPTKFCHLDISITSYYGSEEFTIMSRIRYQHLLHHVSETALYRSNTVKTFKLHLDSLERIIHKLMK